MLDRVAELWGWELLNEDTGDLERTIGPEDILAYIYALLYAPNYRERYAEELQEDFPRVMVVPGSDVAKQLIQVGHELIRLHLLEAPLESNCRLFGTGDRRVQKAEFVLEDEFAGRIEINDHLSFRLVNEDVWLYQVGGFQVLAQWLKERLDRELSIDEVSTFQSIVTSVQLTLEQQNILEQIIDEAGGLPFVQCA
jgi:predicted helicase